MVPRSQRAEETRRTEERRGHRLTQEKAKLRVSPGPRRDVRDLGPGDPDIASPDVAIALGRKRDHDGPTTPDLPYADDRSRSESESRHGPDEHIPVPAGALVAAHARQEYQHARQRQGREERECEPVSAATAAPPSSMTCLGLASAPPKFLPFRPGGLAAATAALAQRSLACSAPPAMREAAAFKPTENNRSSK